VSGVLAATFFNSLDERLGPKLSRLQASHTGWSPSCHLFIFQTCDNILDTHECRLSFLDGNPDKTYRIPGFQLTQQGKIGGNHRRDLPVPPRYGLIQNDNRLVVSWNLYGSRDDSLRKNRSLQACFRTNGGSRQPDPCPISMPCNLVWGCQKRVPRARRKMIILRSRTGEPIQEPKTAPPPLNGNGERPMSGCPPFGGIARQGLQTPRQDWWPCSP